LNPPVDAVAREILEERAGDKDGCWSLVASGDSVTSAHNQVNSGVPTAAFPCPGTTAIGTGIGNDHRFSYAYGVFTGDPRFGAGAYYNFARTGFDTRQMLTAGAATTDACNNKWGDTIRNPALRASNPFALVLRAAGYEMAKGRKVAWATTGGVNNTNWTGLLINYAACDLLGRVSRANAVLRNTSTFVVTPTGQAAHTFDGTIADGQSLTGLLQRGGTCNFSIPRVVNRTFTVPLFNIATSGPVITADITTMVSGGLVAGISKIVWVGYYDMSLATINISGALAGLGVPAATITAILRVLAQAGIGQIVPFVSGGGARGLVVQGYLDQLDDAICKGVGLGALSAQLLIAPIPVPGTASCTRWKDAGFTAATDMQDTAPGGSPHPSTAGHAKLAKMVIGLLP
jgi:hypothetical protein